MARKLFDTRVYVYVDFTLRGTIDIGEAISEGPRSFAAGVLWTNDDSILVKGHRFLLSCFLLQRKVFECPGSVLDCVTNEIQKREFDAFFREIVHSKAKDASERWNVL